MNEQLGLKIINLCVAYTDVGEAREQGCGSFEKLRKAIAPYLRPVGNSCAITCVPRLDFNDFESHKVRPDLFRASLIINIQK